jgi:hypothetical protein
VVKEGWSEVNTVNARRRLGRRRGSPAAHYSPKWLEANGGRAAGSVRPRRSNPPTSGTMSRADDELKHMLRRAERPVAVEGLFESRERRAARLVTKRHFRGRPRMGDLGPLPGEWEPFLRVLRSVKR